MLDAELEMLNLSMPSTLTQKGRLDYAFALPLEAPGEIAPDHVRPLQLQRGFDRLQLLRRFDHLDRLRACHLAS